MFFSVQSILLFALFIEKKCVLEKIDYVIITRVKRKNSMKRLI